VEGEEDGEGALSSSSSDEPWPARLRAAAMHLRSSMREIHECAAAVQAGQLPGAAAGAGAGGKPAALIRRGHAAVQRAVSAMAAGCQRSLAAETEVAAARSQLADAASKNKILAAQVESLQGELSLSWEEIKAERAAAEAAVLGVKRCERRAR
jgi:hypothetical protein